MRTLIFTCILLFPFTLLSQISAAPHKVTEAQADLSEALFGDWAGILEYRDYKEPPTSTKRVQLPTWLKISPAPEGIFFDYTYDDGPSKTVTSHSALVLDFVNRRYKVVGTETVIESFDMQGIETLRAGHGVLVLTGPGKENDKPVDVRTTWTIRRNLLSWLEETRPANTSEPFVFRHAYHFTRAKAPIVNSP